MSADVPPPPDDPAGARAWIARQQGAEAVEEPSRRHPLDWSSLASSTPPVREWAIKGWFGRGHVTLMAGPPGAGKTALAQTMAGALGLGRSIIDDVPGPTTSLLWAGEDDSDELWRRQLAIAQWLGEPLSAFKDKSVVEPYCDRDITLAALISGTLVQTAMLVELREQIGDYKAGAVFLDSIARLFGGNENDRHQVTQFISWLQWALAPTNAALCILGHPAKAQGSEWSGSTAWEASVRSRLYFGYKLPDAEPDDEEEEPDSELRWLAKRKTNYSVKEVREVRWHDGCMQPAQPDPQFRPGRSAEFLADETIRVFRKLKEMGINTGASRGLNYLPNVARNQKLTSDRLTHRDLMTGLAEAMKSGRLKMGVTGKYGNRGAQRGLIEE